MFSSREVQALLGAIWSIVSFRESHTESFTTLRKLKENPARLQILGDGIQTKSYMYIDDCIGAMDILSEKADSLIEVYNVGSEDQIEVKRIANIVVHEMGLKNVVLQFTGGVLGGRGWVGDVKNMLLETSKLRSTGWKPEYGSEESVRLTARGILS